MNWSINPIRGSGLEIYLGYSLDWAYYSKAAGPGQWATFQDRNSRSGPVDIC